MSQKKRLSEKLQELDQQVAWFENEDFDIDEAIEKFEAVEKLTADIQTDLAILENKIVVLGQKFNED